MVKFRKMNEDEFRRFSDEDTKGYAEELIGGIGLDPETALIEARKEFWSMLPNGLQTKDQFVNFIEDADNGETVGLIWFGYEEHDGERQVFLAEFEIYEAYRRKGYATAALQEMERIAKADGCTMSTLYVWDHNPIGSSLYTKCGYVAVSKVDGGSYMKKRLYDES